MAAKKPASFPVKRKGPHKATDPPVKFTTRKKRSTNASG